jgi:hypothetical protein
MKTEVRNNNSNLQLDEVAVKLEGVQADGKINQSVSVRALKISVSDKQKQIKDNQIIRK